MEHESYFDILLSPAHMGAEITWALLIDLLFLGFIKRWFRGFIERRDRRHGHLHVSQSAEDGGSDPSMCEFESHRGDGPMA